ncbi:hypothetical protein SKAU_G00080900 [Synaphobranchus kaupii]|uniref:Uncharacterized protein n=1 Tax=Synaphobranchus kaupii TaxID=118154 RepID=A0A9Q1FV37_SYNKA|nr:hypothetical protein SKAU_G00080900 [Synaphobranchus kaupii]
MTNVIFPDTTAVLFHGSCASKHYALPIWRYDSCAHYLGILKSPRITHNGKMRQQARLASGIGLTQHQVIMAVK